MGIDRTLQGLQKLGFETGDMPADLSLSLGSHALTPMDVARGYTIFANGGYLVKPYILDKVIDRDGNIIFQANPETACDPCIETVKNEQSDGFSAEQIDSELEELLDTLPKNQFPIQKRTIFSLSVKHCAIILSQKLSQHNAINAPTAFLIDSC